MRRLLLTAFLAVLAPLPVHAAGLAITTEAALHSPPRGDGGVCLGQGNTDPAGSIVSPSPAVVVGPSVAAVGLGRIASAHAGGRRHQATREVVRRLPGRRVPRMDASRPPPA